MSDFQIFFDALAQITQTEPQLVAIYVVLYFAWGVLMHNFGAWAKIARFKYWWQIITCYILYMIPISLLLKDLPWHQQYAYGLFFMGILELGGYTLKSSIAFDNNLLDKIFTERNFALCMTLFFAAYFPLGNATVAWIYEMV